MSSHTLLSLPPATAFVGTRRLCSGSVAEVALAIKACLEAGELSPVLAFENQTGRQVDFDLRGTPEEVAARYAPQDPPLEPSADLEPARSGPGRPRLGVVSREVTLLPRHWDWLSAQPGGASVVLRKLVEDARRQGQRAAIGRAAQDAAFRFMQVMAGNLPDFEEASRALYRKEYPRLAELMAPWPEDIRDHCALLVSVVQAAEDEGRF